MFDKRNLLMFGVMLLPAMAAAQSSPVAPPGYSFCAYEKGTCSNLNGPYGAVEVAYGAVGSNDRFVVANLSPTNESISCTNSTFGEDPDPGVTKSCYIPTDPPEYIFCANENVQCNFNTTYTVAFGANGHFVFQNKTNGTACTTSAFGNQDPAPGVVKACFIPVAPPGYRVCASENQTCSISASPVSPVNIAYGANGNYFFKSFTSSGSITCNTQTFFNVDPAYGIVKSCLTGYNPTQPPYGYSFCSTENNQCNFDPLPPYNKAPLKIAYGANGNFIFNTITTGSPITCNTQTFFNVDPDYGVVKSCYIPTDLLGYTACGTEGSVCNFTGANTVAYGAVDPATHNGTFISENFPNGGFTCSTSAFGGYDPAPNILKSCYIPAGPVAYPLCSSENGSCFNGNAVGWAAYYGFNGAFEYTSGNTDTFVCDNTTFVQDPVPNIVKSCFVGWVEPQ